MIRCAPPPKFVSVHRRPVPRSRVVPKAISVQEGVELTGKFLGLFVLFTSSMNWWYYRRTREENQDPKN